MPEHFPAAARTPRWVRLSALLIAVAAVGLATRTTLTSATWVGRVFPGFVVLDNRVVASIGLPRWSGQTVPGLYWSQIVAVEGQAVGSTDQIYAKVASLPPGTPVRYRLRRGSTEQEATVPSQRFTGHDWALLFGVYLLNGAVFLGSGLVVWTLDWRAPVARALLALGASFALFMLTAMDLYRPATFFRLNYVAEALLPAALFQFALVFPQVHRHAHWRFAGYVLALLVLVPYELFLYRPTVFRTMLQVDMAHLAAVLLFFGARLVFEYYRGRSPLARRRIRVVTVGALLGVALPGAIVMISVSWGGSVPNNAGTITPPLFMLALAYAVLKHDLFQIDAVLKRTAYYLVLTGAVGTAYMTAVLVFNLVLRAGTVTDSPAFPVIFALAVLLLLDPLRTRLQAFVDRVFFHTRYNAVQVLAAVGVELGSTLKRDEIARIVRRCVEETIPNSPTRLFIAGTDEHGLRDPDGGTAVSTVLAGYLASGRVITAFDPPELYPDAASHTAVRLALAELGAEVAVPLQLRGKLVGALTAGPKRARLFYTAGDAEFLRALAHEAAIALENAGSYGALAELNAQLEARVRQQATQLVQSEKLASLGRLVAGVAHEINNPVSFVANSIVPLRKRLAQAAALLPADKQRPLREAGELADIMSRGAERTVAIVKDLRSFSRLGEEMRKSVDLHEGLDVTLRLLEPRWRDRIAIHRDYGVLPPVECSAGQVNQVFVNVLANAYDAIAGRGNVWITTRADGDTVRVTIRDDGCGMGPEVVSRIFDPFFTTKDVGQGMGLGLSISHGFVAAHGGRIEVESTPGAGATLSIVLPVGAGAATLGCSTAPPFRAGASVGSAPAGVQRATTAASPIRTAQGRIRARGSSTSGRPRRAERACTTAARAPPSPAGPSGFRPCRCRLRSASSYAATPVPASAPTTVRRA